MYDCSCDFFCALHPRFTRYETFTIGVRKPLWQSIPAFLLSEHCPGSLEKCLSDSFLVLAFRTRTGCQT